MMDAQDEASADTHWRHFVDHRRRATWSVNTRSHPNVEVKEHIDEITMDEQADLRMQGYEFRAFL